MESTDDERGHAQVSDDDRPIDATHGDYVRLKLKQDEQVERERREGGRESLQAEDDNDDPFGPVKQQETKIDLV